MLCQDKMGRIPSETERIARASYPVPSYCMRMREAFGSIYRDEQFVDLFPVRGQPALAPWRLALVLVMQFVEHLSDRQAADAVRGRIDWKYALGLEITDPGFDYSVLSEFRDRLLAGGAEERLLDVMLECFREKKLLKARGKQRTDSTHVLAAVRDLNRLETAGETLRATLNALSEVAPEWVREHIPAEWVRVYGARVEQSRLPHLAGEREALAERIARDGYLLMSLLYGSHASAPSPSAPQAPASSAPQAPVILSALPEVEILRRVWLAQFYREGEGTYQPTDVVQWRHKEDLPPASLRFDSPYDPEALYASKHSQSWVGYKVHTTETCDEDSPHLISHMLTTLAVGQDTQAPALIHEALKRKHLLPSQHLMDSGYVDAALLIDSQKEYGIEVIGPVRGNSSWQSLKQEGYSASDFHIDWDRQVAICPEGHQSLSWKPKIDQWNNPVIDIFFSRVDCGTCPKRDKCVGSNRKTVNPNRRKSYYTRARTLMIRPKEQYLALEKNRREQRTEAFKKRYRLRAGIEGTLSEGVRAHGLRQCRYLGLAKTHLQHVVTAAAVNVARMAAWLEGKPRAKTRVSRFAALYC